MRNDHRITKKRIEPLFLAALILFAVPSLIALTTFPQYYEDESWTYVPVFEAH